MNPIIEYWNQISSGGSVVSSRVFRQYKKLVEDLKGDGQYIYDEEKANRPIEFIEHFCKHSKGEWAGTPVKLELFQKAYISALFGFIDKDTGLRRYKETFFLVARKNGKSVMASAIATYMLIADGEGGAEVYSVATKYQQSRIVFDETLNMIRQSPALSKHVKKRKSDLYFGATMSKFMPLAKNSNTLDGLNTHLCILDECHAVNDINTYEVLKQSMSARRQPLFLTITTAGTTRGSVYDNLYEYACKIVEGTFKDDTFLPVLYELDDKEEYLDESKWPKANPGIGTIKKVEDLKVKVERAKNNPVDLSGVLCKDFNIRQNASQSWLTFDQINNEDTFDIEEFRGCYAIGGADLSKSGDLTCATLLMLNPETERRYIYQMYWLPQDNFQERVEGDKIPYDKWMEQGLLRLCPGNTISYADVTTWFLEMLNDYEITPLWVYYDAWSAKYWVEEMEAHGFKMEKCIQGAKTLSLPMEQMGADLSAKKINYGNNSLLKWCLSNTGVLSDRNGNIVPIKTTNPKMKIDGMASMLNCYVGLLEHYEEYRRAL